MLQAVGLVAAPSPGRAQRDKENTEADLDTHTQGKAPLEGIRPIEVFMCSVVMVGLKMPGELQTPSDDADSHVLSLTASRLR